MILNQEPAGQPKKDVILGLGKLSRDCDGILDNTLISKYINRLNNNDKYNGPFLNITGH